MNALSSREMSTLNGGDYSPNAMDIKWAYALCRVGFFGLAFATGNFWIGFAGAILCPTSDLF